MSQARRYILLMPILFVLAACSNMSQQEQRALSGGAIGAAGGAAAGALVGSPALGAALGGAGGAAIGAFTDAPDDDDK